MKVYVLTSGDRGPSNVDGVFTDWNVAIKAASEWHYGIDTDALKQSKVLVDGKTVWTSSLEHGVRITQIELK